MGKDGKLIKEIHRILKRELAEKLAEEKAKEIDEEAVLKGIELHEHGEIEFAGGLRLKSSSIGPRGRFSARTSASRRRQ